jgi:hypothetical protein
MEKEFLNRLPERLQIEGCHEGNQVFINGHKLLLSPSLKVRKHSPDGFNWGYGGSGPAQFALALLLQYLPKEVAGKYYQDLKFGFIAGLPRADFIKTINLRQIMQEIIEKKAAA